MYKRQVVTQPRLAMLQSLGLLANDSIDMMMYMGLAILPVSYTHLDVYKRQEDGILDACNAEEGLSAYHDRETCRSQRYDQRSHGGGLPVEISS